MGLDAVEAKTFSKKLVHHLCFLASLEHFANLETFCIKYIFVILVAEENGNFSLSYIVNSLQVHFERERSQTSHHCSLTSILFKWKDNFAIFRLLKYGG